PNYVLAAGDVYVVANPSANMSILALADITSSTVINYNGDDAVALTKNGATGTLVDVFGRIGEDPGTAWVSGSLSTLDRTLRRKTSVTQGVSTHPVSGF